MSPAAGTTHSLRRRLLASVLTAIALAALLQAVSAYRGALQQADEMFDYHLQQMAQSLRGGLALGAPPVGPDGDDADYAIQIWGPDGVQLFRSAHGALPPRAVLGFSDVELNGTRFRVYSLQTPYQTVQIAQDMGARESRARALAVRAVLPMLLIGALLMLVMWWTIRRSLAPLERARVQVATRQAEDLAPLPAHDLPDEVRPLVQEINLLFDRVHTAFDAQKSFVANAAHELRSPLTALKLQAQALARQQPEGEHTVAIARLNQGIDRAIRLMNQLLVLARQEGAADESQSFHRLDLQHLAQQALADAQAQARDRRIDLALHASAPAWVDGDADALLILLRNVLDNAIKYSPEHSQIEVAVGTALGPEGEQAWLRVDDPGPGIPAQQRERVFERFFRSAQAAASSPGSGLGLAIVQAIAARHRAVLNLSQVSAQGGLRVEVKFRPVRPSFVPTPLPSLPAP